MVRRIRSPRVHFSPDIDPHSTSGWGVGGKWEVLAQKSGPTSASMSHIAHDVAKRRLPIRFRSGDGMIASPLVYALSVLLQLVQWRTIGMKIGSFHSVSTVQCVISADQQCVFFNDDQSDDFYWILNSFSTKIFHFHFEVLGSSSNHSREFSQKPVEKFFLLIIDILCKAFRAMYLNWQRIDPNLPPKYRRQRFLCLLALQEWQKFEYCR